MASSRRGQTLVSGHTLLSEGEPYDADGHAISRWDTEARQTGRAKCSCGELSDPIATKAGRKRWHRDHKDEVKSRAVASLELA